MRSRDHTALEHIEPGGQICFFVNAETAQYFSREFDIAQATCGNQVVVGDCQLIYVS